MVAAGTPDHNESCALPRRSPLSSHTTTRGLDGPTVRYQDTPRVSGTSRARPADTPNATRRNRPATPPHHRSGTYGRLVHDVLVLDRCASLLRVEIHAVAAVEHLDIGDGPKQPSRAVGAWSPSMTDHALSSRSPAPMLHVPTARRATVQRPCEALTKLILRGAPKLTHNRTTPRERNPSAVGTCALGQAHEIARRHVRAGDDPRLEEPSGLASGSDAVDRWRLPRAVERFGFGPVDAHRQIERAWGRR